MTELAFCPTCMKTVRFTTIKRMMLVSYEGKRYRYATRRAICDCCGSEATYPPYQEESGRNFNEAIRTQEGLVSLEVIYEVPRRYDIGKRPLSRVLGFGEHTYAQLMEGQTPNRAHSDLITRVYDDPGCYLALLEKHRGGIGERTYLRSKRATQVYMQQQSADSYRVFELGRMLVDLSEGDVTSMALQKLAYYVQAFSKPLLGYRIFGQMPCAWAKGPVYEQLWRGYKDSDLTYFAYDPTEDHSSPFTPAEDELIRAVYASFGNYSGSALGRMTHKEKPWIAARDRAGAQMGDRCDEVITEEDMDDYFEAIVVKYSMTRACDISRYAKDAFDATSGWVYTR